MSRCISCKGRGLCGRAVCPILRRFEEVTSLPRLGNTLAGDSPPEVFVGRHGYPLVRAGPLIPAEGHVENAPSALIDMGMNEIVALRSSMVRSEARIGVKEVSSPGKILQTAQEIAMSSVPVATEVSFLKPPRGALRFDGILSPTGPSGPLLDVEITSNPVVPRRVDQLVEDGGVKAFDAIGELYAARIDVDHISRLLSLGLLGKERRMVPTRWSITASDDMVGKGLVEKVLDTPLLGNYLLFSGERLGNHFEIILLPEGYSFELMEIWLPRSVWTSDDTWIGSDTEGARGKKGYSPLAGGYYAARLAVLEGLERLGRQAGVLALREITEEYWAPLGVWVVREAARAAMRSAPLRLDSLEEALNCAGGRLRTPMERWRPHIKRLSTPVQTSLAAFL